MGLDVWWDQEGLGGGSVFPVEILEAIIRQRFFLFLLSPRSVTSHWCLRELIRATELRKKVIPLILEDVPVGQIPLELAGLQYVRVSAGVAPALPGILGALGLRTASVQAPDDPFARDGRLIEAIADQLSYATTFTDTLNMVQLLKNIGLRCCETDRARGIFENMCALEHYRLAGGMKRISYEAVKTYLLEEWKR